MEMESPTALLVYSVGNSTAKYETRAERLNECGDNMKELIRELRVAEQRARIWLGITSVTPTSAPTQKITADLIIGRRSFEPRSITK